MLRADLAGLTMNGTTFGTYAVIAATGGVLIPVMAALNGGLGRALGSPTHAALVLFVVGFLAAGLVIVVMREPMPALSAFASAPIKSYVGGIIVCIYILSVTYLAPRFGVANTIMFVMIAQIFMSAAIDHFGLFGAEVRRADTLRLAGLGVLIAGVIMAQWRR